MRTPRTLILLRHAKSAYPEGVPDHDRPLAPRGIREGALAGDWLREHADVQAVLCSTATRTRQTLDRTAITAPVRYVDRLYDSTPGILIDVINHAKSVLDVDPDTLLVIGHEPVMSATALGLAGRADPRAVRRIHAKFPTSAIAVLQTDADWADLQLGGAQLCQFHVPR